MVSKRETIPVIQFLTDNK